MMCVRVCLLFSRPSNVDIERACRRRRPAHAAAAVSVEPYWPLTARSRSRLLCLLRCLRARWVCFGARWRRGGRAFGDGTLLLPWLGARRWWVRCSRVVGLAHALMCVLRTCYLFLLRCLRAWRVGSARAGVGHAGVLVTARAVAVVVGRAHAGGFAIARAVWFFFLLAI